MGQAYKCDRCHNYFNGSGAENRFRHRHIVDGFCVTVEVSITGDYCNECRKTLVAQGLREQEREILNQGR